LAIDAKCPKSLSAPVLWRKRQIWIVPGLTAKATYQEVARDLRRAKFCADSYINDRRATVEFRQQLAGVMAKRAARIAPGSPMSGQEESDVGHSRFNHDQWR
jgi:hypothetical protein